MSDNVGFLEQSEEVIDQVSDWAVEMIKEVTQALNPSGKPYDHEEQDVEEQIAEYIPIRGNPESWLNFIDEKAQQIIQRLHEAGVPEDAIISVHPYDIAAKYAINYSAYMEEEIRKRSW